MDQTEAIARDHLLSRGFRNIVFEPDGKVPPDFLVDSAVAVEVRRLNQREPAGDRGLEDKAIPFCMRVERLLADYGDSDSGTKWMALDFCRPLPRWKMFEACVKAFLADVDRGDIGVGESVSMGNNLRLEFVRRTPGRRQAFELGAIHDLDAGGFVLAELCRNLWLCVNEKSQKVRPYRQRYGIWWLLLVDTVAYALSIQSRVRFREMFGAIHDWDNILIVSPLDPTCYFEL